MQILKQKNIGRWGDGKGNYPSLSPTHKRADDPDKAALPTRTPDAKVNVSGFLPILWGAGDYTPL